MPTLNDAVIEALKAWRDEHLPEETTGDILLLKEALNEALAGGSSISVSTHTAQGVVSATDQHVYDELNVDVHGSNGGVRAGFCIMPCCAETKTRMLWMYSSFIDRSQSQLNLPDEMYYTTSYFRC